MSPTQEQVAAALKEYRQRIAAGCTEWDAMEFALRAAPDRQIVRRAASWEDEILPDTELRDRLSR